MFGLKYLLGVRENSPPRILSPACGGTKECLRLPAMLKHSFCGLGQLFESHPHRQLVQVSSVVKSLSLDNFKKKIMKKSGIILLTSAGLSSKNVYNKFKKIVDLKSFARAVIITTASYGKENNQYSQLALSQLKSAGFTMVDFYDFENDGLKNLSTYDVIYVCGGNTFKLMKFAKEMNFDKEIRSLLKRDGMYIGVSAGSLIIGPSIRIAGEIHSDANEVRLTDFTGFNIIDLIIFPHYSSEFEEKIKLFETKNNIKIERLTNSQAMLFEGGKETLIE
jgi:dipeptidase E